MRIPGAGRLKKVLTRYNQRGIILMYHRVANLEHDPWCLAVSPERFEEQMRVLKKYGKPLKMTEMSKHLGRFAFGREEIAVTFDDGYEDNLRNALPILEKYAIPATFYIVSGGIGAREEFWWDEIERMILVPHTLPPLFEMKIEGTSCRWQTDDRKKLHLDIWEVLSHLTYSKIKEILRDIGAWAGCPHEARPDYLPMTASELVLLAKSPLAEIGAHTVHHPMLSRFPAYDQQKEITQSKAALEDLLGRQITSFSYPHGDHSDETVRLTQEAGFTNACTVVEDRVERKCDPFRMPRFMVFNWKGPEFEHHLYHWIMNK